MKRAPDPTLGEFHDSEHLELKRVPPRRVLIFGSVTHIWSDLFFALLVPLLPYIKEDLELSYSQVGLLRSFYSGSSALLQIPAGFLAETMGEFWMITIGNIWVSAGLIVMGIVPGFLTLIGSSVVAGVGGGTQHPLASSMVSRAYDSSGRSAAVGTVNFAGDIGKMMAPAVAASFVIAGGWRIAMWAVGIAGNIFFTFLIIFGRSFDPGKPEPHSQSASRNALTHDEKTSVSGFVVLTGIGILDSAARNAALIFFPFIMLGRSMGESEVVISLLLLFSGGAAGKYICGWLNDRTGTIPLIWLTKGGTSLLLLAALFAPSLLLWPIALVLGVGLNGTSSVLYATVAKFIPAHRRGRYYGYFYTTNEIGTIGAPLIYGLIADLLGLKSSIFIMAVLTSSILPTSLALKKHLVRT